MVTSAATVERQPNIAEALPARRRFTADEYHRLYAAVGIPELWLAEIARKRAFVHRNPHGTIYKDTQIVGGEGFLSPQAFPDLRFPVANLFK